MTPSRPDRHRPQPLAYRRADAADILGISPAQLDKLGLPTFQHVDGGDRYWAHEDLVSHILGRKAKGHQRSK